MRKHDELTKHIDAIESASFFGEWVVDRESKGMPEDPIQIPFVEYGEVVDRFVESFYETDFGDPSYMDTLEEYGVELELEGMFSFDVSDADERLMLALITTSVRIDRFICEGALLESFENGCMLKWLKRLRELDEEGARQR